MSEIHNDFNFSTEPLYTKFSIGATAYILREASEEAHTSYKNVTMRAMRFQGTDAGEKRAQMTGGQEADTHLVAKCLFKLLPNPGGGAAVETPVPFEEVSMLPRRITSRLYNWIKHNSGMDEELETVDFLTKRIASDQAKLTMLTTKGTPGKGEPSSISSTSG